MGGRSTRLRRYPTPRARPWRGRGSPPTWRAQSRRDCDEELYGSASRTVTGRSNALAHGLDFPLVLGAGKDRRAGSWRRTARAAVSMLHTRATGTPAKLPYG